MWEAHNDKSRAPRDTVGREKRVKYCTTPKMTVSGVARSPSKTECLMV